MQVFGRTDIETLLDLDACREAVGVAMADLSAGRGLQPLRTVEALHDGRDSALFMPAVLTQPPVLGVKVVTIYPDNHATGIASHHGALLLFESRHGRPVALLEGSSLTAIRTAAVSALATDLLARANSRILALIGTGVQARSHLAALPRIRPFGEVRVWSPDPTSRQRFVDTDPPGGVEVRATETAEEAVRGADVVCTLTSSATPVLSSSWISPGTHINAVGASTATTRELDTRTVADSIFFIDCRNTALAEAGDLLLPIAEGAVDEGHIRAELGELVSGRAAGRGRDDEITVFKSLGLAVQDLAAAQIVLEGAEGAGLGTEIDWQ